MKSKFLSKPPPLKKKKSELLGPPKKKPLKFLLKKKKLSPNDFFPENKLSSKHWRSKKKFSPHNSLSKHNVPQPRSLVEKWWAPSVRKPSRPENFSSQTSFPAECHTHVFRTSSPQKKKPNRFHSFLASRNRNRDFGPPRNRLQHCFFGPKIVVPFFFCIALQACTCHERRQTLALLWWSVINYGWSCPDPHHASHPVRDSSERCMVCELHMKIKTLSHRWGLRSGYRNQTGLRWCLTNSHLGFRQHHLRFEPLGSRPCHCAAVSEEALLLSGCRR